MTDQEMREEAKKVTEGDACFRNWKAFVLRRGGHYRGTIDEYRGVLLQRLRDEQQMTDMGR